MAHGILDGQHQSRPGYEQKSRNEDADDELDQIQAGSTGDGEHTRADHFELFRPLAEQRLDIGRSEVPDLIDLAADERPSLDRLVWRRNGQAAVRKARVKRAQIVAEADAEPGDRA